MKRTQRGSTGIAIKDMYTCDQTTFMFSVSKQTKKLQYFLNALNEKTNIGFIG